VLYCRHPDGGSSVEGIMTGKTCAASDGALDANAVTVTIGGKAVEVCCDDCARKLKEAQASATTSRRD
jgi:hypothetical protein